MVLRVGPLYREVLCSEGQGPDIADDSYVARGTTCVSAGAKSFFNLTDQTLYTEYSETHSVLHTV